VPQAVHAEQGEHVLSLAGYYINADSHGGGAGLSYSYGFSDFWNLHITTEWGNQLDADEPFGRVFAGAGILYHIDALQWVPYVAVTLGTHSRFPDAGDIGPYTHFGAQVSAGLDYRPIRRFSMGVFGTYHLVAADPIEHQFGGGLRVSAYF
jgi:hypothetical protein